MKRTICLQFLSLAILLTFSASANACCLLPLLNPFNWGCGYGCGGYGYNCGHGWGGGCGFRMPYSHCGTGYGYTPSWYAPPAYPSYQSYPVQSDCNCTTSATQPTAAMQMPVVQYQHPYSAAPVASAPGQYNYAPQRLAYQQSVAPLNYYGTQTTISSPPQFMQPQAYPYYQQSAALPVPAGDITGDHEYPSSSHALPVTPQSYQYRGTPIQPASYRVAPRSVRSYSSSVR